MATPKFTEEQKMELRELKLLQKRKTGEVMEHFKTKYGITVNYTDISNICGPKTKDQGAPKKKSSKKPKAAIPAPEQQDDLMSAVSQLDEELKKFCATVRRTARREIIKYVARMRKARIAMGETIGKEETDRLEDQLKEFDIDPKEIKEVGL